MELRVPRMHGSNRVTGTTSHGRPADSFAGMKETRSREEEPVIRSARKIAANKGLRRVIVLSQAADSLTALGAAAKNSCTGRANWRNWALGTAIVFHLGEITRPSAR